ncbi:MAG: T9SS type A sorting domain-containing protein [Candidatus Marinimicrobia bacterium]|nr:T9SS type A sorting domain-containing protein [Candidatus Neomarinimicrobiota bacterium]
MKTSKHILNLVLILIFGVSQLESATVYLVLGSDTAIWDGMAVNRYHNTYNQALYTDPSMNTYEVMDPAFRAQFVDSYGQPMKMTWWMMAGNIFRYATNRNFPVPNIMTMYLMKKYHGENVIINGDELSLHYHTFFWSDYDQDGMYFWNQSLTFGESRDDFDVTLAQFLLEADVFPVSFRSGWHFMDNEWQHYLNEILPYSMHNAWPANHVDVEEPLDNTYNWSESPSTFVPFQPSLDNYMVPGDGPAWNVRSVSFGQVAGSSIMNNIFEAASNGTDQVACLWAHLPESDFPEKMAEMNQLAHAAADLYPDVDFRYCTAIEAMQLWRGTIDGTPPEITVTSQGTEDNRSYQISSNEPLYMPQPYVAVKYRDESYGKIECIQQSDLTWTTEIIPFPGELAKLGVAATDTSGNLTTEFVNLIPDDIYMDNEDIGYNELRGVWTNTDNAVWGVDARTASTDENNTIHVSWSPDIQEASLYHVFIQVPTTDTTPFPLKAVIHSNTSIDTVTLMAPLPAHEWIYLATVPLNAGQNQVVELFSDITQPVMGANLTVDAIKLTARVRQRDIHLSSQNINYGEISLDRTSVQNLRISNLGTSTLSIQNIESINQHVNVDLTLPMEIEAMGEIDIPLTLHPLDLGPLEDTLRISSDDPMHPDLDIVITANVQYPFYVVDNEQTDSYSETGEWFTSVAQAWGLSSRYSWLNSGASASFRLEPEEPSYYEISYIVPTTINSSDNALYLLKIDGAPIDSVFMDQNANSGQWVSLGTYFLPTDVPIDLEVHDVGNTTQGPVLRADAVKIQMLDPSAVEEDNSHQNPQTFVLRQNYPNPFNPTTTISYVIPFDAQVSLKVYDIRGQEIVTLMNEYQSMGHYQYHWSGLNKGGQTVSTGVYFCRLTTEGFEHTIKMLYLR